MAAKLQHEIGKLHPFECKEQEVYLNIERTADFLRRGVEELFRPYELSSTQYNVLRILRGAKFFEQKESLPCGEIGQRMVTRDPDITRLLDRLEKRGFITRARQTNDRRVVKVQITDAGLEVLAKLDEPITKLHRQQLAHVNAEKLQQLNDLLENCRDTPAVNSTQDQPASTPCENFQEPA